MAEYLIKSSICLAIFLLFYCAVMEKERMHHTKRIYLLGTMILAFCIPLISITHYVDVIPGMTDTASKAHNQFHYLVSSREGAENGISLPWYILYVFGVMVSGVKFTANLIRVVRRIRQNPKSRQQDVIRVLVREPVVPHTFFNYIFLNIGQNATSGIPKEVWLHEVIHARQKHSLDVLFVELLQVFLWFNPLIYLYKGYIKSNHEFLADEGVLKHDVNPVLYQHTLLHYSYYGNKPQLASGLKYSSIKKRINIMKKQTSKNSIRLRTVLIIPLLVWSLYSFSDKVLVPRNSDFGPMLQPLPTQDKATPEMVAEYNALARKYNEMSRKNFQVKGKEVDRLNYLYGLMTDTQRNEAEPFPEFPEPPIPPAAPRNQSDAITAPDQPRSQIAVKANRSVYAADAAANTTTVISVTAPVEIEHEVSPEFINIPAPPAPPAPPNPLEHMKELAQQGAKFFYNDQPVPAARAYEIVNTNRNLHIYIENEATGTPLVKLSNNPIEK